MKEIKEKLLFVIESENSQDELIKLLKNLISEGFSNEAIIEILEDIRVYLQKKDLEELEDKVLEAMDYLTGWCSPHMKL
jgi:hypothetical protein